MEEEIFGPVVCAVPFKEVDEVLTAANSNIYGLAAAVWTRDISKAHSLASELRAGTVWINCFNIFDAALPFHETAFLEVAVGGDDVNPTRNGLEHRAVVPYGVYGAGDGYLAIAAGTEALWQRLAALIGGDRELGYDLSTNDQRVAHRDDECVRIDELHRAVDAYEHIVRQVLTRLPALQT